jgi:serine protease Do
MSETPILPRLRNRRRLATAGGAAFALALAGATVLTPVPGGAGAQPTPAAGPAGGTAVALPRPAGPADFADLAARVTTAVVRVTVSARLDAVRGAAELPPELRGTPFEEYFRRFGGGGEPGPRFAPPPRRAMGQGSGFIIDPQGYVVTNNHVVGNADKVTVELADGRKLEARVVGTDPQTDIALIKVEAGAPLPHVAFGDSDALRVGEWVLAMGNPFGLGGSATAGIVSARGRQIGAGPYDDFIQTDAPINPGNSGGPLFAANGAVVGVNTAIFSPSGGNIGIGFAVPSNLAQRIVQDLRDDGKVERGWLGVMLQPLDAELAQALGVKDAKGALIGAVEPGSPAARSGLRAGDVVVAAAGRAVEDPRDLANAVAMAKPGSEVPMTIARDGQRTEHQVQIGEPPNQRVTARGGRGSAPDEGALGLALALRRGGQGGVEIVRVEPGSIAEERGLRPGDVILRAGDRAVSAPRDVAGAIGAAREAGRPAIALQIERGVGRAFVALPLRAQEGARG